MSDSYVEVDATDWVSLGPEQAGSKPSEWLEDTDGAQWLMKYRTENRHPASLGGGTYYKGDDWAEKIASEIGRLLGIPCAHVELSRRADRLGVLSKSVLRSRERLVLGNEVLGGHFDGYPESEDRAVGMYTVAHVVDALRAIPSIAPPSDSARFAAADTFVEYLVLDAIIGNTDRHHRNWAIVRRDDGHVRLSPSFDHASSLGFAVSDATRKTHLGAPDGARKFASKAQTPFAGRPHPATAAAEGLGIVSGDVLDFWIERGSALHEAVYALVDRLPTDRMSAAAKEFARAMLQANLESLSHAMGTVTP
jgi:hypothetical protein